MGIFGNKFKVKPFKPFDRKNIGIAGLGLIGGSLAKALTENLRGANIAGVDPDQAVLDYCMKEHIINFGHKDINILRGCEVIFICTPIETVPDMINRVYGAVGDGAVITDVAGVKKHVFAALPKGIRFVSGHPMSGSEKTGFANSDSSFLENCAYILIRESGTDPADFDLVKGIISAFTDRIIETDAKTHDETVAASSHLTHIAAYTLAGQVLGNEEAARVVGRGFKDITRIAATPTALWTETCRLNAGPLLKQIEEYRAALDSVKSMIENGQWERLKEYFEACRDLRTALDAGAEAEDRKKTGGGKD